MCSSDLVYIVEPAEAIEIVTQPTDFAGVVGDTATFTVEAEGATAYQWQVRPKGSENNWGSTSLAGAKTDTLTFAITAGRAGNEYRCKLTNDSNDVIYTNVVYIVEPFEIVTQPTDFAGVVGDTATFTVEAVGATAYQWQVRAKGSENNWGSTSLTGAKTDTLTFAITAARAGNEYRCKLTNNNNDVIYTDVVYIVEPVVETIEEDGVVYVKLTQNTVAIQSYSGNATSLAIPETVNGCTVTAVGACAFEGNQILESIDLPDTITVIGNKAFKNCINLREMH